VQSVDLHGIRHKDASDLLVRCCSEYDIPFLVITGKSPQMKKIVAAVARSFDLSVRDSIDNPGRVVVDESR
jgi:hypothetical protein|tara:strand:- start:289 stop:501 length:213 start_codon:yes stop_codon:yes gene_type:complete